MSLVALLVEALQPENHLTFPGWAVFMDHLCLIICLFPTILLSAYTYNPRDKMPFVLYDIFKRAD